MLRPLLLALALILTAILPGAPPAVAQTLEELVAQLPEGEFADRERVIGQIAATGDPRAATILEALGEGDLEEMRKGGAVVLVVQEGRDEFAHDPFTGERIEELGRRDTRRIKMNNNLRRLVDAMMGQLQLASPDPALRLAAAGAAFDARDASQLAAIDAAIAREADAEIAEALREARAATLIGSGAPEAEQVAAIELLAASGRGDALGIISQAAGSSVAAIAAAAADALAAVERTRAMWGMAESVWQGLSLGSVLMLAAIGLAISFGVMGVINMAHGELVMLGAYTTFFVQEIIRNHAPELFGASLAIALPLAFLVSGGVGVAIERGICRHLYGRPLETLLATWGVSLILQQAVRTIFGPNNREVGN
ncbi:MAG: urea ABC transporter permease subunit UrtB, partial [Pseudomonadota bacterium]